jgi:hypothetical protein
MTVRKVELGTRVLKYDSPDSSREDSRNRTARTKKEMTVLPECDGDGTGQRQNMTARTGQPWQDSGDSIAGIVTISLVTGHPCTSCLIIAEPGGPMSIVYRSTTG